MATSDFIIVVDGVEGESPSLSKGMDLLSFGWGGTNSGTFGAGGGGGAGKAQISDLHFTKYVDKGSPALMQNCASGKHIPKAVLHVHKAGGDRKEYYTITLTDVLVSSYQASATNGDPLLIDQVSLNFAKIEWEYKTQDAKGALVAGGKFNWDIKANKA